MDILGQSSLLVAVTSFALGFSVLARNVRNILFLSFAMLSTLVSAWALSFFLEKIWGGYGFYRLHLFFNILLAPAALTLIRVMARMEDSLSRRLLNVSLILAAPLVFGLVFHWDAFPGFFQLIYFTPILVVFQILRLIWLDQKSKIGSHSFAKLPTVGLRRRTLIYFGALAVLSLSVMDHVPWMGKVLPSLGNLGLVVYLFFVSQAITQQRLLNINALISRFLVLLVVALTLTAVYSLLVAWIQNSPSLFFLNSFIASFLLLMLLDPLRSLVWYFTQRLLTQKHRRLQEVLFDSEMKLTGIVDLSALSSAVMQTVEQTLQPEWGALFVLIKNGTKFRRVRSIGREPESKSGSGSIFKEVLANHPILQYCGEQARGGKFPVLLDQLLENEIDRSASRSLREHYTSLIQGLRALGSNLLIPLMDSGKMLGFVTLWVPSPPDPWGNNWGLLPIIYPYFKHAAQTMQNMEVYARLREKERLATLGEMAAGLAHEIRNPLGAIKGAAQFLDPSSDRPESQFLKVIIEEVDRLNRVVTQFLDYSKPPTLEMKLLDASQLVEKTIALMRSDIHDSIKLEFQPLRTSAWVQGSSEQLRQVLINLILNSQRALEKKTSGLIRISVGTEGEGIHREVFISVEDNGHGIKKENLEKLFIPFFTTSPSGTGLGLSISQKIVEAHRGRIEVVSEEDRFTKISVIFPYVSQKDYSNV